MDMRVKRIYGQLGKKISEPGAHMPSAAVGLLRQRRTKKDGRDERLKGGHGIKPIKSDPPFPLEFEPGSM